MRLFAAGCPAHGAVRFSRAKVRAKIDFSGSRFINPGDDAIRCPQRQRRTLILGPSMATDGITNFRFSRFVIIQDDHLCWPRQMRLSGLGYDVMDPLLPADKRVEWLHWDIDGYLPRKLRDARRHAPQARR